jgi:hypothetical protein
MQDTLLLVGPTMTHSLSLKRLKVEGPLHQATCLASIVKLFNNLGWSFTLSASFNTHIPVQAPVLCVQHSCCIAVTDLAPPAKLPQVNQNNPVNSHCVCGAGKGDSQNQRMHKACQRK